MTLTLCGPYSSTLILNTPQQVQVEPQCVGFIAVNRNRYIDLYMSFSQIKPNGIPSTLNATGGSLITDWNIVVPAGQAVRCEFADSPIVGTLAISQNTVGPTSNHSGQIWVVCAQNSPDGGFLSPQDSVITTGVSSTSDMFYFICWNAGDIPPDVSAAAPSVDLTGQPRPVALRTAPPFICSDTAAIASASTWTNVGNAVNIGDTPFSNLSITNGAVPGVLCIVMYSFAVGYGAGSTALTTTYKFRVAILDSTLANVTTVAGNTGADADYHLTQMVFAAASGGPFALPLVEPRVVYVKASAGAGPPYWAQPQIFATVITGTAAAPTVDTHYDVTPLMPIATGGVIGPGGSSGMSQPPQGGSYAF